MNRRKSRYPLTNENLTKHYTDNFTLSLDAIEKARALVEMGRDFNISALLDQMAKTAIVDKEIPLDESKKDSEEQIEFEEEFSEKK